MLTNTLLCLIFIVVLMFIVLTVNKKNYRGGGMMIHPVTGQPMPTRISRTVAAEAAEAAHAAEAAAAKAGDTYSKEIAEAYPHIKPVDLKQTPIPPSPLGTQLDIDNAMEEVRRQQHAKTVRQRERDMRRTTPGYNAQSGLLF